jgi:hypothetical protein
MRKTLFVVILLCCAPFYLLAQAVKAKREYYQITIYHFKDEAQKLEIDSYLEKALLPALHRMKINNVGVFTPIANDTVTDKKVVVIMPATSLQEILDLSGKLFKDESFRLDGKKFIEAAYDSPPFTRMEKLLLYAFPKAPVLNLPGLNGPKSERIYEFRSYESPTEKLFINKVQMFNEGGEVALFKRLNFNAVFYAGVIAGGSMPNLIYMTSFENMADRDAHWKTFSADPEWKKLSGDPAYQHNVSKADIILMKAASFSDY